jgi:hypothetical protein
MPIVRAVVGGLGLLAFVGAGLAAFDGAPLPVVLVPAFFGVLLLVGTLFERIHYKRLATGAPGRGWVETDERFVDPTTGRLVQVHFQPNTGQRTYVDIGEAPRP